MLSPRRLVRFFPVLTLALSLAACGKTQSWHETDISGAMKPLAFTMTRADDGKVVTAKDYRGKIVLLYFGYTFCPDVCPTTLSNLAQVLDRLGPKADQVRILFVTVDPNRDSLAALKQYVNAFAPEVDGLRGDAGQLAALAKRYRVAYSVKPGTGAEDYQVSHGSAVYVFDRTGKIRLLLTSFASGKPEIAGSTADIKRLIGDEPTGGLLGRLRDLF